MYWQSSKFISKVLIFIEMLIQAEISELIEHGSNEDLIPDFKTAPKHSDVLLAEVQGELTEEGSLATPSRARHHC